MSDSFPFKWINKKWKEGFYVTSMATSGTRWAVVMSRNAGFVDQCVELDFMYPSEGIHRRWDSGFRITCTAATPDQVGGGVTTTTGSRPTFQSPPPPSRVCIRIHPEGKPQSHAPISV